MKALTLCVGLLTGVSILCGCKQVRNSIDNTFNPSEAAIKKQAQKPEQTNGSTVTTTRSNIQLQNHDVIINGDAVNMIGMQEKAAALFKNIDAIQKNNKANPSAEMQEKVNEFLKDVNLQKIREKANRKKKD
ncbi:hypothetical protein J7E50_23480 [Pedobacter sp. ISL-68]|uniref:hypothetical protein n=1 Tax=unclassified Pedobacter TaxID=2628915 RepID=UPI001BEA2DD9|nr:MULTISPECIES: hypothetical protein [unclassified Pedobacter]MBT2564382.1 hypothetical protein [Pedobacter sp. ISL-64]MBT2593202.1 hypothetical protein [Pedobacter sp. ISL-68]